MNGLLKKAGLGVALAATAMTAAVPADAQRWGRGYRGGWGGYHHHGGGRTSAALLGGIVGLGVGAAIASSARPRYYNDGYYSGGYYAPPPRRYYYDSYYEPRPRCWTEWRYDPYYGDRTPVRICG